MWRLKIILAYFKLLFLDILSSLLFDKSFKEEHEETIEVLTFRWYITKIDILAKKKRL